MFSSIGNSVDSLYSHIAWVRNIEEKAGVKVPFPVVADLDQKVARAYGMVHEAVSDTATVRAVFAIDPEGSDPRNPVLPDVAWAQRRRIGAYLHCAANGG